jgi:hypothetical protein
VRLVKRELRICLRYSDFHLIFAFIVGFWQHGYGLKVLCEQLAATAGIQPV